MPGNHGNHLEHHFDHARMEKAKLKPESRPDQGIKRRICQNVN